MTCIVANMKCACAAFADRARAFAPILRIDDGGAYRF